MEKISDSKHRIRELMNIMHINQTELCSRTGINKSALSNYLNGDRLPRQDQISKIADAFGVDPAWIMGYDTPMVKHSDLSPFDINLLKKFHDAPQMAQKLILQLLEYGDDEI